MSSTRAINLVVSKEIYRACVGVFILGVLGGPSLCFGQQVAAVTSKLAKVRTLIAQGKFDIAEHQVHRLLLQQPESPQALDLLGLIHMHQGRYADAESELRHSLVVRPKFLDAVTNLGTVYLLDNQADKAEKCYLEALKISPDNVQINFDLAELYQKTAEFQRSLDYAAKIPAVQRTPTPLPIVAADYLGLNQGYKASLEIKASLQVAAKNPGLVPKIADFMLDGGAVEDANELLKTAATLQPQTEQFQYEQARVEEQKGNRAAAREILSSIIHSSPNFIDALVEAGRLAGKDLAWNQAADLLASASLLAPQRVDILLGLVAAQLYSSRIPEALKTAKTLYELRPEEMSTAYFMALSLVGNSQWSDALPFAKKLRAARPDDREANLVWAVISYNLSDLEQTKEAIQICLKLNASDPAALFYLAMVQKTEGNSAEAIKILEKSIAGNPANADAQSLLGELYLKDGDLGRAQKNLEEAVRLAPERPQSHYQLALVYGRSGMQDKAAEQLRTFQQLRRKESGMPAANSAPPPLPQH